MRRDSRWMTPPSSQRLIARTMASWTLSRSLPSSSPPISPPISPPSDLAGMKVVLIQARENISMSAASTSNANSPFPVSLPSSPSPSSPPSLALEQATLSWRTLAS